MTTTSSDKYFYDAEAAERVIAFIERHITHVKGEKAGQPFILEDWQKDDIIRPLFGMKNKKTGLRKYQTCYIELPRKNGKSSLSAGLALYLLFADGEKGAEVYSCAGDRQQAKIVFDIAKGMALNDPGIKANCKLFVNSIVHEKSNSFYKAISAEASSAHGFNASGIIFDELHVQPNRDLWDTLTTSTGARKSPITIAITTAGYDKNSICWEVHEYALKIKTGALEDESFLSCIYAAGTDDDFTKEETWKKANPGYGSIVKKEYLEKEAKKAEKLISYQNTFKRLHLNQWTTNETKWLSLAQWEKCNISPIDLKKYKGRKCWGGLDLASVRDLTAFVLIFEDEGKFDVLPFFFSPKENAYVRSRRDGIPYLEWEKLGLMDLTPGNVTDYDFVQAKIMEICEQVNIQSIAFDRWNSSQTVINMTNEGLPMEPFGQGFASMSAPTKMMEALVLDKKLNHGGNKILNWQIENVQVKLDPAANCKLDKSKSKEKIDGIIALVMALGAYLNRDEEADSGYEDRGIVFI